VLHSGVLKLNSTMLDKVEKISRYKHSSLLCKLGKS
jgi:hypothetical protein